MQTAFFALALLLLAPPSLWAIGFVYTGVGSGRRELMELTETTVDVTIQDRVALTRTDQVFTNRSGRQTEGIYEFKLPAGAVITDLVLWIDGRPVQGIIMEKEAARRTYDDIVRRRVDPALIEQIDEENFRLSIFPFPPEGSRRVELEYMQLLEARNGQVRYTFPLAPETDLRVRLERFILRAAVASQHPFVLEAPDLPERLVDLDQSDNLTARLLYADEAVIPTQNLHLSLRQTEPRQQPTVLSFPPAPGHDMGYYALWLPPLQALADADAVARSLTFVIDVSSSMQGPRIAAVKTALSAAIADLGDADLFNIVVFSNRAQTFAEAPVAATQANKEAAVDYVQRQGALGVTHFEAAFAAAFGQTFPAARAHQTIFLTDGHATIGQTDPTELHQLVAATAPPGTRLFAIGVGPAVNRPFLRVLADDFNGEAHFVLDETDLENILRSLFAELARPVFAPSGLAFDGTQILDQFPRDMALLAQGQEFFQVGRYDAGGDIALRLEGTIDDEALRLDFPVTLNHSDTSLALIPRLWAQRKVEALEAQIDRFGPNDELLDAILDLGLSYRLVTRRTSLFAPDDNIVVNPEASDGQASGDGATAVEEATATLLDRKFVLRDQIWVDVGYRASMPLEPYRAAPGQPAVLADFARLGKDLIVVVDHRAYSVAADFLPQTPVLAQNHPNPFNAATRIGFGLPPDTQTAGLSLTLYNLAGQRVRHWPLAGVGPGQHHLTWDGRDQQGRPAASGVYIYRLSGKGFALSRRLLLLR